MQYFGRKVKFLANVPHENRTVRLKERTKADFKRTAAKFVFLLYTFVQKLNMEQNRKQFFYSKFKVNLIFIELYFVLCTQYTVLLNPFPKTFSFARIYCINFRVKLKNLVSKG